VCVCVCGVCVCVCGVCVWCVCVVCVCVVCGAAVCNRRYRPLYIATWLDLVNCEWEGVSGGAVVVCFRILFRHSPLRTEGDREKL